MTDNITKFIRFLFDNFTHSVEYNLDEDNNITLTEKNSFLGSTAFAYSFVIFVVIVVGVLSTGLALHEIEASDQKEALFNKYYVDQICIDNNKWTECRTISNYRGVQFQLDNTGLDKTIYIRVIED